MRKFVIIPIFFYSLIVTGASYYVKNGGNDSNTGLSDAQAWAHHPWMSTWTGSVVLSPGDVVNMKRGDTWSIASPTNAFMTIGQSGSEGNPITTTWYGSYGNKPLIQITGDYPFPVIKGYGKSFITFDRLEIKHFSPAQDLKNCQDGIRFGKDASNNLPHDWIITNCDIHNIPCIGINGYDDSYNIIIGNTLVTSYATSQSYSNNIYDCGYAGIVLCGRDPATDHSHWDVYYNYIHDIDISGEMRDAMGISFTSQNVGSGQGYSTGWPDNCVARFNHIKNIPGSTGIDCHGGTNIFFQDNYVYNCRIGIILQAADRVYAANAILDNGYIERNIVENSGNTALGNCHVFIYVAAENVLRRITNCFIRDNIIFYTSRPSVENGAYGICLYNLNGATVEGNKIYNGPLGNPSGGIGINSDPTKKVKNVSVRNNWISNWDKGIDLKISGIDGDIAINNNIVSSDNRPLVGEEGIILNNIKIYNNTFLSVASASKPYLIDFVSAGPVTIANGGSLTIKNNLLGFTLAVSEGIYFYSPSKINGTLTIDNNLFWNSTFANPFNSEGTFYNWANWGTHGFDIHSHYNTNPLLLNSSGSYSTDQDFRLQSSSPAINAGTDVGLTSDYAGNPISGLPDIGAFEVTAAQPAPAPVFLSSVIENATPSRVDLTYSLSLANIVPPPSAFTVNVNSSVRTVSSVAVSGTKVLLTLSGPVTYTDAVTVAYTKPSSNPLQTTAGGEAASFTAKSVTNSVYPPSPVFVSSVIENASPSKLDIIFSLTLANIIPAASAFTVRVGSAARAVNSVSVSGTKVSLTLASPVVYGDAVTVAYSRPSSNPLQSAAGGQVSSTAAQTVTNYVTPPVPAVPVYTGASIQNAAPAALEITYNLSLANIVPAASAFTVQVNSAARSINSVAVSGTKVTLTLSSAVAFGNAVTVAYTKPSSNPLQTAAGGQAASLSAQNVTNNVAAVAIPVPSYVSSSIENATPSRLDINYNLSLANIVPAAAAFSVLVNSTARSVSSVTISGTKVFLTLSSPVVYGNVVTVAYTKPSSNPLQTAAGGQAASLSAQNVTNNVAAVAVPVPLYVSSSIENSAPSKLNITYSLTLANIIPAAASFSVTVNSLTRSVSSVAVSGTIVTLTLASAVTYNDVVTVAYTKPSSNPMQTTAGGQAASITARTVTNNVQASNVSPVVVVAYQPTTYSGFVNELDASASYDSNNDNLTFQWTPPPNAPVSGIKNSKIQFLSPVVDKNTTIEFSLKVSDGKITQSEIIPVVILPYKPQLKAAEIIKVEASSFQNPNNPYNILDGNIGTMWSANGDNQWLILRLKEPFNVQHVMLAFLPGLSREAYFDILGSEDGLEWEPILTKSNSCGFSGDLQVFDFPASKTVKDYSYVKLVGHSNSSDTWNYVSEFRIFGYPDQSPEFKREPYKIYPNPASEFLNITTVESDLTPDKIRIVDFSGRIVLENVFEPDNRELKIPLNLNDGIYLVQLISRKTTFFSQKLIISN